MEEDTEYLKLPLEDRCVHKLWKARLNGYEECTKHFPKIVDEKAPEFSKFAPLMKKFVTDSNAVAQEKALDAVLAYVENAHIAARTAGDVTAGVVQKCLAAPKRGTQEKGLEIVLMYCEIEKYEVVQEELMKGFTQKNPKVVAAAVRAITTALREFGPKVINPKPLMKQMHTLLEDRDKNVREESKKLVIELYRWIRQALKPQMSSLKPIQIQELETEFEKMGNEKVVQTRFLRSQQELKAKIEAQGEEEEEEEEEGDAPPEIDVYDLLDPVDILSKLPKDFYEKLEAKKWQERKEAVDLLLPLTQTPRLEPGDYHELMKLLKKMIAKDTNVMIVAQAALCVSGLAKGLKKKFTPFALAFTETVLEKFREKKINVVTALREAIDAIFQTTSLESIQETVCGSLHNKNPQVKAETAAFIGRALSFCTPTILTKKLLKAFTIDLLKTLNESDATVRDQSAVALGTALRVVGEKTMMVFIADVDDLKMQKIKEAAEKAEMKVKVAAPKTKKPAVAKKTEGSSSSTAVRGGSRPTPAGAAVKGRKAVSKGGGGGGGGGGAASEECQELELSVDEALEKAGEVLPEDVVSGLTDANWKTRLGAMETFNNTIQGMSRNDIPAQALVLTLAQKPGFKDNNFQVLKLRLESLKIIAENSNFTRRSGEICIQELVEKLADSKNGPLCGEVLIAVADAATLQWVGSEVMNRAFEQKNPKIQEVALKWMSDAITEFGFVLQPMALIGDIKKALAHTNPGVRTAGVSLCGTIFLYMGAALRVFFVDEKPALLQQIDDEFEKRSGDSPPTPTRGVKRSGSTENDGDNDGDSVDTGQHNFNAQDMVPRVSIGELLTENLFTELADKNWKVRNEALQKISNILSDAKFIKGDIGELPGALCSRMNDSNKNIALEALRITSLLSAALGSGCKPHTRTIVPGMLVALGDSKQNIRQQALSTLNSWVEQTGLKETVDGEVFSDALKSGSPFLKSELFIWMAEKLKDASPKSINKEELHSCTQYLFMALEDRNADVRKGANEAVLPFMIHLGYDGMNKHTCKVKPSSKNTVVQALEKAKSSLPARPQPKPKGAVGGAGGGRGVGLGEKQGSAASAAGLGRGAGAGVKKGLRTPSATRTGAGKKDTEDVDTSPLLQENSLKQQRALDEQRLRVLRWDFTAPRQEFVVQLKDQMTTSGINRQLMSNMFHQDFKFHIKAIDGLNEDLSSNLPACIDNLDLVLKWLTIRFFDTNPSVIIRAMDYLKQVFQLVSEEDYHLLDLEAYSFLPFLVTKFGDPKDSIRGSARNIAKLICNVYPASKVSPYMMEGLKAKNARQRAECLEALGSLIEVYGMSVCQPSPGAALKEVAKQISDRDNSVRNASLNVLVQVYFREGEKVFKLVGNLSDKDMCLLEERIKRAAKNRPVIKKPPVEPEVPTVRGGAAAAAAAAAGGRANRVIPTLAQPAPVLARNRKSADGAAGIEEYPLLKRRVARNPSWSSDSVDQSQEDLSWSPPVRHRLPKNSSLAAVSSSISSLSSMSNISSMGSINNLGSNNVGTSATTRENQLKGDWPLPPLRRRPIISASLEKARRISRSLSFVLGEPDLEPADEESSPSAHVLPPLSPHMPPPLLTRTVTSPHFTGYGLKSQPQQQTNVNAPFKIDYSLIEKLLEDNEPSERPQYNLEEVPDLNSILNYKAVCPTPASRMSRPGFGFGSRPSPPAVQPDTEGAAQAINMVISQVATPDANSVITALSQLDEVLQSEERCVQLAPHIDQLLIVATLQYRLVLHTKMATPTVNKEECIKIYRSLTNCVMMIFNNKMLGTQASRDVLRDVVYVLIHILLDPRLTQLEDGPQIVRAINVLVVRIVEKAQFTHVFSALLKLLHESVGSGGNCKFTELVMKCNWKVIRILPSRSNDLDLDQILLDVHNFLMAYPPSSWNDRPSDTPLRTIKTVMHTLCKTYGTTILSHFTKIENAHGSELHKYLTKTLKKPKTDDDGGAGDSNRLAAAQVTGNCPDSQDSLKSPKRLSKTAHNTLSEIFRKIGSKENTKEGLIQLYDFKQKHPEADIEPFLKKSSQFFQNYIERGLKRVEMERQADEKVVSCSATENGSNAGPLASIQVQDTANFNMNDVIDQFKSIAARAGFDNTYICTAVKDICSTEKDSAGEISEYIKTMSSELAEQNKEQFSSNNQ